MAYNVFGGWVPDLDDHLLFPGRVSHSPSGSEMKVRATLLVLSLFLWATPAFSQGCSMCRSSAAATSKDGQKAIGKGVLVLVVPPIGFMTLGVGLAFRYGKKRDLENC
jgi:hypothetical protein